MTFTLLFVTTMAWAPVLAVLAQTRRVRGLTEETRVAARRSLLRCLAIASAFTAATLATWLLAPHLLALPAVAILGGMAAFHLGWWYGANPLMRRTAQEVRAGSPQPPVASRRVASLVPRDESALLPPALWAVPIGIVVAASVAIAVAGWTGRFSARSPSDLVTVALQWLGAVMFLVGWGLWARAAGRAPQDLAGAADATEVDRLCRDFRRFVVRALFVGTTLAVALFAGAAALRAWWGGDASTGSSMGLFGGIGGSVVGVWGAIFGVLADRRRRAIIELGGVPPDVGVRRRAPVPDSAA